MTDEPPPLPSTIGKRGSYLDPDGTRAHFTVVDEIRQEHSAWIYLLQLLHFDRGDEELRLGYYVLGKKGRTKGRWVWGQYAMSIPLEDLRGLVEEARRKGWL